MTHSRSAVEARQLIQAIAKRGVVTYTKHARERMLQRHIDAADLGTALRAGVASPAYLENGSWRHQVTGRLIKVVVQIVSTERLVVITAISMRKKG